MILSAISMTSYGGEVYDLKNEERLKKELGIFDHRFIKTISFTETFDSPQRGISYTFLRNDMNSNDSIPFHMASINSYSKGQKISFKSYANCEERDMHDGVIKVNGQNIQVVNGCGKDKDGYNAEVYIIKTDAGLDYIVNEFKRKEIVKVGFGNITIPFSAKGFIKAWDSFGGAAL